MQNVRADNCRYIYKVKFLYRLIYGGFISALPSIIYLGDKLR
jgi:hypothetical protein